MSTDFPRGPDLPQQSPIYWVQQKDRYLRQLLIRDIEAQTGRRLVVYFADRTREGSRIDSGDIAQMAELTGDLDGAPVDLFLESPGGETDATEAIISLLRVVAPDLRIVVPHSAKSNGTLICLAGQEIVMGPTSELGPIDPSLNGIPCSILIEKQIEATNFPLHKLGALAIRQTRDLATRLLSDGMMKCAPERIAGTVDALATRDRYSSHGSVIDHEEAATLGLAVRFLDGSDALWQRLWLLYCMYAHDVRQTGYTKIFEGRLRSTALQAPA